MRNIPKTFANPGTKIAMYVFKKPNSFNIKNNGNIVTCDGITIELRSILNMVSLPLNLYFAKANPAIELNNKETTVTIVEINTLFIRFLDTSNLEKSVSYCTKVNSSGKNLGGKTEACPSNINDADNIQINGARVKNPVKIRKPYKKYFLIYASRLFCTHICTSVPASIITKSTNAMADEYPIFHQRKPS